jgi:hypothetical protein
MPGQEIHPQLCEDLSEESKSCRGHRRDQAVAGGKKVAVNWLEPAGCCPVELRGCQRAREETCPRGLAIAHERVSGARARDERKDYRDGDHDVQGHVSCRASGTGQL